MKSFKNNTALIPVKMWTDKVEDNAFQQIDNLASLPFAFHHLAIMPDCHSGYGMPIGGVLATEGVIIPNAVGVDIGCGMCAVRTNVKAKDLSIDKLKKVMQRIRDTVPVGFNHHKEEQDRSLIPHRLDDFNSSNYIVDHQYRQALSQVGTLGGGNHFIEIQKDQVGDIWIMIHSGSRNLGKKVADYYNMIAVNLNHLWCSSVPKEWQLAFLHIQTEQAKNYLDEMNYCVEFAEANRRLMMSRVLDAFVSESLIDSVEALALAFTMINIAHNYARFENHFGKNVMIHRKGATSAKEGEIGIIPGSQGTKSYIVRGKGNVESFQSCSHGAGRKMGRKEASRSLNLADEIKKLDDQGIVHGIRTEADLDEATGAYKDIDVVMENQKDLVEIVTELTPMAVIKG